MPVLRESGGPGASGARLLELDGVRVTVPSGWEARMRRAVPEPGGVSGVVTHAATVPLPAGRGDYGSGVVERLTADDVFVGLVEFGPEAADTPLFPSVASIPRALHPSDLRANQLQRIIPGQGGKQKFFTYRGRPFCLYVVVGSLARRAQLTGRASQVLSGVEVLR